MWAESQRARPRRRLPNAGPPRPAGSTAPGRGPGAACRPGRACVLFFFLGRAFRLAPPLAGSGALRRACDLWEEVRGYPATFRKYNSSTSASERPDRRASWCSTSSPEPASLARTSPSRARGFSITKQRLSMRLQAVLEVHRGPDRAERVVEERGEQRFWARARSVGPRHRRPGREEAVGEPRQRRSCSTRLVRRGTAAARWIFHGLGGRGQASPARAEGRWRGEIRGGPPEHDPRREDRRRHSEGRASSAGAGAGAGGAAARSTR